MPGLIQRRRSQLILYPNIATSLVRASSQRWAITDNATLSMSDIDFSVCGWFYLNSVGVLQGLCCKGTTATATTEYTIYVNASNLLQGQVANSGGATQVTVSTTNFGALSSGNWYFASLVHDSVGNTVTAGVNLVTNQSAYSSGAADSAQDLVLGALSSGGSTLNGLLDCWGIWKNEALSSANLATIYNLGVGMAYKDLPSALKTNLIAYYNFDGNGNDSHDTQHLTAVNGASFSSGKR